MGTPVVFCDHKLFMLVAAMTEHEIQLQLAKEEEADALRGVLPLHKVNASSFLHADLDIEEHQYVS